MYIIKLFVEANNPRAITGNLKFGNIHNEFIGKIVSTKVRIHGIYKIKQTAFMIYEIM